MASIASVFSSGVASTELVVDALYTLTTLAKSGEESPNSAARCCRQCCREDALFPCFLSVHPGCIGMTQRVVFLQFLPSDECAVSFHSNEQASFEVD